MREKHSYKEWVYVDPLKLIICPIYSCEMINHINPRINLDVRSIVLLLCKTVFLKFLSGFIFLMEY